MSDELRPTDAEQEFFLWEDIEKRRRMAVERRKRMAESEKEELRLRHWMRCPKCGEELHVVKMRDVETNRCFNCGGCWMDEPEMTKLSGSNGRKVVEAVLNMFNK